MEAKYIIAQPKQPPVSIISFGLKPYWTINVPKGMKNDYKILRSRFNFEVSVVVTL